MPQYGASWGPLGEPPPRQQLVMKETSGQGMVPGPLQSPGMLRVGTAPPCPPWGCLCPLLDEHRGPAEPAPRLPFAACQRGAPAASRLAAGRKRAVAMETRWKIGRAAPRLGTRGARPCRRAGAARGAEGARGKRAKSAGLGAAGGEGRAARRMLRPKAPVARCPGQEPRLPGHGPSTWAARGAQQGPGGVPRAGARQGVRAGPKQGVSAPHIPPTPHQGTPNPSIPVRSRPSAPILSSLPPAPPKDYSVSKLVNF